MKIAGPPSRLSYCFFRLPLASASQITFRGFEFQLSPKVVVVVVTDISVAATAIVFSFYSVAAEHRRANKRGENNASWIGYCADE